MRVLSRKNFVIIIIRVDKLLVLLKGSLYTVGFAESKNIYKFNEGKV